MDSIGLYALKPWYAVRLTGIRDWLIRHQVRPNTVSCAGIGFGVAAGAALAVLPIGWAGVAVGPLLAARLAAANLDGALARETGSRTRRGSVLNEVGDRAAELAVLAGCFALAPAWLVLFTMLIASAPSWVSLAGAAAGPEGTRSRINGGPMGKTERCLLLTVAAIIPGSATVLLVAIAAGSALTAVLRARTLFGAAAEDDA
jgi:CDP-diacylglycerol--glycerol-3-phosphate 3-phosphatidyltransferase